MGSARALSWPAPLPPCRSGPPRAASLAQEQDGQWVSSWSKSLWREPDATMRYFPLFADLAKAPVLVVGGGEQATQKVRLLRKTSAHITVVAKAVTDELRELGDQSAIWIIPRAFLARDLDGQRLV